MIIRSLAFLLAMLSVSMAVPACTYCQQPANATTPICKVAQISKVCGAPEVVKLVLQYLPQVVVALLSGDYMSLLTTLVADLEKLGISDGTTVITCAVQTADANAAPPNGAAMPAYLLTLHSHAASWLLAHPVKP